MHLLDLGISRYLLEFTRTYLQQKVGMEAIKEMDSRLRVIPRHQGLIIMKNGLENISRFTANDYRNIMKVIVSVMDNLYVEYRDGGIPCEKLCEIFHNYMEIYIKTRQESFTENDLNLLEVNLYLEYMYMYSSLRTVNLQSCLIM